MNKPNTLRSGVDENGHFGIFGGRYVAETLMPLILNVEKAYEAARHDDDFWAEFHHLMKHYVGRPSPLYFAERLTEHFGGAKIYMKRDELNHTGAHKINNTIGQILLARRMGKKRIIAETGAGQHGVATATVCALFGLKCVVYMGATDVERQKPNVFRMKLLGAEIVPVTAGTGTLKDAMNEALRDWVVQRRRYLLPDRHRCRAASVSDDGPRFPMCHRRRNQACRCKKPKAACPIRLVASIGGGSNAMGLFHPFLDDDSVRIIGVEAAGHGIETGEHCASLNGGKPGVLHGNRTYLLQNDDGQILDGYSISAGSGLPGDRARAFLAAGHRTGRVCVGNRQRSA